jgi:hypothetical protein
MAKFVKQKRQNFGIFTWQLYRRLHRGFFGRLIVKVRSNKNLETQVERP